uniref:Homeobox domain-containing protein n=1 Tax=Heterorhabditis bacteriophora TaxID=37862 RepID=A0A1I7X175_HETBA
MHSNYACIVLDYFSPKRALTLTTIEAFRQLDQVDSDLDSARQQVLLSSLLTPSRVFETSQGDSSQSPILLQHLRSQAPVPVTISASSPVICSSPDRLTVQTVPPASTAAETTSSNSSGSPVVSASSQVVLPRYENNAGGRPIRSLRTPMREITTLDDPRELDEFMIQGEEACIADMKLFITQYSLRQTTVAMMTGVSQPYISKLLNGNHRELSLRCRKNIYCWYLNCRRHPEKLAAFLADPASRLETNGDGELVPQRRERYVFRPILIRMLEGFFAQSPFPDLTKRIEIATACNHVLQLEKKGVGLMPKEVVSPQVVANWFANKRKELRRRSQETGEQPGTSQSGNRSTPGNDDTTSSGVGSTPSPMLEENSEVGCREQAMDDTDAQQPMDVLSLASRLGIALPQLTAPAEDGPTIPFTQSMPVATLASQILAASAAQNLIAYSEAQPVPLVTLASQLLSTPQVSLANPLVIPQVNLSMLPGSFPVLHNENDRGNINSNILSLTYDQLRNSSNLMKNENME